MTPKGSVVVATRLRPVLLRRCLAALHQLAVPPWEIIVVDNSEGDEATRITAESAGARYILEPTGGQCRARNAGARAATGDIVAFLDDDVVVDRDWLQNLLSPFGDARVSAVTGRIVSLSHEADGSPLFGDHGLMDLGAASRTFDLGTPDWFEKSNFGGIGHGGNMALRRALFSDWSGFRESIGHGTPIPGGDEHYAFFELIAGGHRIEYVPSAVVAHPDPDSLGATRSFRRRVSRQGAAYLVMLLFEEPTYRWRALRFVAAGTVRRLRSRGLGAETLPVGPGITLPGLLWAALDGPALYLSARQGGQRHAVTTSNPRRNRRVPPLGGSRTSPSRSRSS